MESPTFFSTILNSSGHLSFPLILEPHSHRQGDAMRRISEQHKSQIHRLIDEGESLDPLNLEASYGWIQASYQALEFDPIQRYRFAEYCGSSCDSSSVRLVGVWILKEALNGDTSDKYIPMGALR